MISLHWCNLNMIPTPGQPEQEYLAARLRANQFIVSTAQSDMNLVESMVHANQVNGFSNVASNPELLSKAIDEVLLNLPSHGHE